jgi:radical SAM superfamily enzyme YgiQ (UPF0313 family)
MDSCRVTLVMPDFEGRFDGTPLGLAYLGAALSSRDHHVEIVDLRGSDLSLAEQVSRIEATRPDILGFSSTSPSLAAALDLAEACRARLTECLYVKGGPHEASGRWREVADCPSIHDGQPIFDLVVTDRWGEASMLAIAEQWAREGNCEPSLLEGVAWASRCNTVVHRARRSPLLAPTLPPARELLPPRSASLESGVFDGARATQLMVTRGCRHRCAFCAIDTIEASCSFDALEADLERIVAEGNHAVFIDDATFTSDWATAAQVSTLLAERGLAFAIQTRVDQLDHARLQHLAASGCRYIYLGIESGSPRVQAALNKPQPPERTVEIVRSSRALGMRVAASMMFGVPLGRDATDDEEDWKRSVTLIQQAGPDLVVPALFAYYPGSPAWATLPKDRRPLYLDGENLEEAWNWFDDGRGAIHAVGLDRTMEIEAYLKRHLGDFLEG